MNIEPGSNTSALSLSYTESPMFISPLTSDDSTYPSPNMSYWQTRRLWAERMVVVDEEMVVRGKVVARVTCYQSEPACATPDHF